eukprot:tig00000385_g24747.t1
MHRNSRRQRPNTPGPGASLLGSPQPSPSRGALPLPPALSLPAPPDSGRGPPHAEHGQFDRVRVYPLDPDRFPPSASLFRRWVAATPRPRVVSRLLFLYGIRPPGRLSLLHSVLSIALSAFFFTWVVVWCSQLEGGAFLASVFGLGTSAMLFSHVYVVYLVRTGGFPGPVLFTEGVEASLVLQRIRRSEVTILVSTLFSFSAIATLHVMTWHDTLLFGSPRVQGGVFAVALLGCIGGMLATWILSAAREAEVFVFRTKFYQIAGGLMHLLATPAPAPAPVPVGLQPAGPSQSQGQGQGQGLSFRPSAGAGAANYKQASEPGPFSAPASAAALRRERRASVRASSPAQALAQAHGHRRASSPALAMNSPLLGPLPSTPDAWSGGAPYTGTGRHSPSDLSDRGAESMPLITVADSIQSSVLAIAPPAVLEDVEEMIDQAILFGELMAAACRRWQPYIAYWLFALWSILISVSYEFVYGSASFGGRISLAVASVVTLGTLFPMMIGCARVTHAWRTIVENNALAVASLRGSAALRARLRDFHILLTDAQTRGVGQWMVLGIGVSYGLLAKFLYLILSGAVFLVRFAVSGSSRPGPI